jgi:hypothetical protein
MWGSAISFGDLVRGGLAYALVWVESNDGKQWQGLVTANGPGMRERGTPVRFSKDSRLRMWFWFGFWSPVPALG